MLKFDHKTHTYTLDGEVLPSVTQIFHRAGLVDDRWFNDTARDRGTAVHEAIHFMLSGGVDASTIDPRCLPYFKAFKKFRRDTGLRIYKTEIRVWSTIYSYAGTIDFYGRINGARWILDYKTGAPGLAAMQTAAYFQALKERGSKPQKRGCLSLTKYGTYSLTEYKDLMDFSRFIQAQRAAIGGVNVKRN